MKENGRQRMERVAGKTKAEKSRNTVEKTGRGQTSVFCYITPPSVTRVGGTIQSSLDEAEALPGRPEVVTQEQRLCSEAGRLA